MKMFELDNIMELANDASFIKGEDYYNSGRVKKIIKTGNIFEGTVRGTSNYTVTLDISDNDLHFQCTCPYDFEGICKHSVAFALAVLNGKYSNAPGIIPGQDKMSAEEFKKIFNAADAQKKQGFLKQLLDKDTDLQSQFIAFIQSKSQKLDDIAGVNIDEIRKKVNDELCSLDFDDIVGNYNPYDGGYYDNEGYVDAAYDEIRDVFRPYITKALEFIKKGNLLDGARIMLGLYEGSQNLPDPENSEYDIFDESYDKAALRILKAQFDEIISAIEQTVKPDEMIHQVFDLVMQRFNFFENQEAGNVEAENIVYDIKVFETLFIILLINAETASYLYKLVQHNDIECLGMAFVLLKIGVTTGNENLWIDTAESFAEFEPEIAQQLLEKYKLKNETHNFNRIAGLAFNKWPDEFDLYLIENLDKISETTLYLLALKNYTAKKQSVKHYKELREYLTELQKREFVDKIGEGFHDMFYVQLLDIENRHSDILSYARKRQNMSYDLDRIIGLICNIYPEECYEIIKNNCDAAMNSSDRNRRTYQRIAGLLKVMGQINTKQPEAREYIRLLYNHKPNLPALKDELRKALNANFI